MKQEKKRKKKSGKLQNMLMMVFFMVIGGVCGVMMGPYIGVLFDSGKTMGQILLECALLFVGLYVAMFLEIIIHEAGHMVFGLLTGYKFSSFRIMSFMLLKEEDGMKFRRLSLAGTGGQCLMIPPDMVDGKFPFVLYNLGGSLLNILSGLMFLGLYFLLGNMGYLSTLLLMLTVIGFGFALVNGLPLRLGSVDNDGYNTISIRKNPDSLRAFWVQLKINEQSSKGVRLKDMPEKWFLEPERQNNAMVATLSAFHCNRLMDEHRLEDAERKIQQLLSGDSAMPGVYQSLLACDRICCLLKKGDGEGAKALMTKSLTQFMKTMKKYPSVLRTQYVYSLLAEGNEEKACVFLSAFEKMAKSYPYPVEIESERELMALLIP